MKFVLSTIFFNGGVIAQCLCDEPYTVGYVEWKKVWSTMSTPSTVVHERLAYS